MLVPARVTSDGTIKCCRIDRRVATATHSVAFQIKLPTLYLHMYLNFDKVIK